MYGISTELILKWVERCLDRLADVGAATIVTQLPAQSIERLGERRFRFFRRLFFPRSKLTLAGAREQMYEINRRLVAIGESRNISVISVPASWYGFDPIHLKRAMKRAAWPAITSAWRESAPPIAMTPSSWWTAAYLSALAPSERSIFGFSRRAAQPSGRFSDGTTISIY